MISASDVKTSRYPIKFIIWLALLPVYFLLETLVYKAIIKARNNKSLQQQWARSSLSQLTFWFDPGLMDFNMFRLEFFFLTAEILAGPRR